MQTYQCSITLEVDADEAREAAEKAQRMLDEPGLPLFVWSVGILDDPRQTIDLEDSED